MRPEPTTLVVLAMVVLAGCAGTADSPAPPSDERALDVLASAQNASATVGSYRFTVEGVVTASSEGDSRRIEMRGSGSVDVANRRMIARTHVRDRSQTVFVNGTTAIAECPSMGWDRRNVTATPWIAATPLGRSLESLTETQVYWRGTDVVNGTTTAVIVAYPSLDVTGRDGTSGYASGLIGEGPTVHNVTQTTWIDRKTGRVLRVRRTVSLSVDGASGTATVSVRFDDYGANVSVDRPAVEPSAIWTMGCPG
ncbi:MAG: hypothetical protein ABEJ67_02435 [Halanaeroarchaeum sp.]